MSTFVVLLRAVNVAGFGKLAMADLRKLLEQAGFERVETYIQSGNAVLDGRRTAEQTKRVIAEALEKHMGAPVGVLVRTHAELTGLIEKNPFAAEAAADGSKVHVVFLSGAPGRPAEVELARIVEKYPERRERYHLAGDALYLHLPLGAADHKFTGKALERALGMGTGRNWNTVLKLHAMSARA